MEYKITGNTRLTGLLGSPVSHSISPLMHNEAFRLLGLPFAYLCFDVGEQQLAAAVNGLKALNVRGFNCTMPDKAKMCELADELSPAAGLIGAVNTVVNENGRLIGHNTDGTGYIRALQDENTDISGKTMTLLGIGGAATAICVQAALDGAKAIHIFNRKSRSWEHGQALADRLNRETLCQVTLSDIQDTVLLQTALGESDILTNATPLGMSPREQLSPIPENIELPSHLLVSDIIYSPRQTQLLKNAKQFGCHTCNGLYMLLYQGAKAFGIWTGQEMPVDMIKEKYF